ncbi:MAG: type I 3-dehydroquinate dehydratase [Peptostreptococcaceae bacterium]|nr:type I 3-dehydroquinate dehydratase [Peptostreptococcaceae bacterium]
MIWGTSAEHNYGIIRIKEKVTVDMENNERIIPEICGTISGRTAEAFRKQFMEAEKYKIGIIEWRLDAMVETYESFQRENESIRACIEILRKTQKQVILTLRSFKEGGFFKGNSKEYFEILMAMDTLFGFGMIDIEYARWIDNAAGYLEKLPGSGSKRIVSHHDFERVPESSEILALFGKMERLDAAFVKGAFMPKDFSDTLRLMEVALDFNREHPERKLIYMAMGEAGMTSRILTGEAASAITYGSVDTKNLAAPGQLDLGTLTEILNLQRRGIQVEASMLPKFKL